MNKSNQDQPLKINLNDLDHRQHLVEERDKNLAQIMSIHGRFSFGLIGVLASVFIGLEGLSGQQGIDNQPFYFILPGIALLFAAVFVYSHQYFRNIRKIEKKLMGQDAVNSEYSSKSGIEKFEDLPYQIRPRLAGNILVGSGLMSLVLGTIILVKQILNTLPMNIEGF